MHNIQAIPATAASGNLQDADLVSLTLAGEHFAFEAIIRRNNQRLFRLARSIVDNDADAEDALQESYIRAYTRLSSFRGEASLGAWLGRIVVNEALGRLRRQRARPALEPLETVAEGVAAPLGHRPEGPERSAAAAELRRLLEAEIDRLPDVFRTVFMLREVEQLSLAETAQVLAIPVATVKTRCHRAKLLLRQALSDHFDALINDAFPFLGARCDRVVARVMGALRSAGKLYTARSSPPHA